MVSSGIREDTDIEFKGQVYSDTEKGHTDAASDVAPMANGPGGVIFLGIDEDNGAASSILPISFSEATEQRIRQAIISRTAPPPRFDFLPVPTSGGQGVYAVIVPSSPYAPHSARIGSRLAYPKRAGPHTRRLSESEIADAYR